MKKLIALTLVAASSLAFAGTASALPDRLEIQVEGSDLRQQAECYFLRNVGGQKGGACDYACDIDGPSARTSKLSVFFREGKTVGHTQCIQENAGHFVATWMTSTNNYGLNQIFDLWDEKATLLAYMGSEVQGLAFVDSSPVALGLAISGCP